jgi:hypothetical protein
MDHDGELRNYIFRTSRTHVIAKLGGFCDHDDDQPWRCFVLSATRYKVSAGRLLTLCDGDDNTLQDGWPQALFPPLLAGIVTLVLVVVYCIETRGPPSPHTETSVRTASHGRLGCCGKTCIILFRLYWAEPHAVMSVNHGDAKALRNDNQGRDRIEAAEKVFHFFHMLL